MGVGWGKKGEGVIGGCGGKEREGEKGEGRGKRNLTFFLTNLQPLKGGGDSRIAGEDPPCCAPAPHPCPGC